MCCVDKYNTRDISVVCVFCFVFFFFGVVVSFCFCFVSFVFFCVLPFCHLLEKKPKKQKAVIIFFSQKSAAFSTFCHSFRTLYSRSRYTHRRSFLKSLHKSQNGTHHRGVFVVLVVVVQIKCSKIEKKPPQRENLCCDGREAVRSAEEIHESTTNGRTSFD